MKSKSVLSALVALGGLLGGCGEQTVWMGEAGGAGATCAGQCVPLGPYEPGWTEPALLWRGDLSEAPDCPESAPIAESVGFGDLGASNPCSACQCEQPTGSCALSSTLTAYTTYPIVPWPPGTVATSFDAPAGWSGACTMENAIPAGKQCNGAACVHSVTLAPLTLTESACTPRPALVARSHAVNWGTGGRVCRGHAAGDCADPGSLCAPRADPKSQGFAQCVSHEGDKECPSAYVVKHVLYQSVADNRTCTPCACEAPTGSTCEALVSIFSDGACSSLVGSYQIDATMPSYHDIMPVGTALGSKSANKAEYTAGSCAPSGGDVLGEVTPSGPTTFCCLP